jgi:hypothetical protein
MFLLSIKKSDKSDKKMTATFCLCSKKMECKGKNTKTVDFGLKGSTTYLDSKDKDKRAAYIARHKVNEDFNNPLTAGSLAKHILWGATTSLKKNIELFKKKFKL